VRLLGPRLPGDRLFRGLVFVYHCCDRLVIHGCLSSLSRPEQVVHFFRHVVGVPAVNKEVLSRRTADYQNWVEAFARPSAVMTRTIERLRRFWAPAPKSGEARRSGSSGAGNLVMPRILNPVPTHPCQR
jgi:hypothetical protein